MPSGSDYSFKASIGAVKRVPGGYLHMGSSFHPRELEQEGGPVYVAEFDIAQAPVTLYQYAAFINTEAIKQERWWTKEGWNWLHGITSGWGRENRWRPDAWEIQRQRPYHPVTGITFFEAQAYCAWLSHELKRVVRLPSEKEWEYAARGHDWRPFPWGERFSDGAANTLEADLHGTIEAASTAGDVSPFGVKDMAGNVQEWTASPYQPMEDEVFPDGPLYVVRSGSYNDTVFGARTSYRRAYPPGYFFEFLGFRVLVAQR